MRYVLLVLALIVAIVVAWSLVPEQQRGQVLDVFPKRAGQAPASDSERPLQDSSEPASIWRWRDESGTVHFGERPPSGVEAEPVEERGVPAPPDMEGSDTE